MRAAMMEEFRVAEEAREANVRLNQLSQEEVSLSMDTIVLLSSIVFTWLCH